MRTILKIWSLYNWKTNRIIRDSGKKLSKPKIEKESKYNMIKNIRNIFKLKREKGSKDNIIKKNKKSL